MKIAINISPLTNQHKHRGIGVYTQKLIESLQQNDTKNEYVYFQDLKELKANVDLVHYPFFDPFFTSFPLIKRFKTIVTVHDLTPIIFQEHYPRGVKGEIKWQIQKRSLLGSSAIITDSQNSKNDIAKLTKFNEGNIFVVHLAQSEEFKPLTHTSWQEKEKERFNLKTDFILYVGDVNYNKNIPTLLKAFAMMTRFKDTKLVLVGEAFLNPRLFNPSQIPSSIKNRVSILGYLDNEDLVKIYNLATVLCLPSLYEGFGLPIVEAMSCSTPVICSNNSSLTEVAGNAAIFINPLESKEIAHAFENVIEFKTKLPEKYFQLKKISLEQSKKFSWKRVASQTIKVYDQVYKEAISKE